MSAKPARLVVLSPAPDREQERRRARERVEAATGYVHDNTEPLDGPRYGASEWSEERRIDGRHKRRVTACRVSSVGIAAWLWRMQAVAVLAVLVACGGETPVPPVPDRVVGLVPVYSTPRAEVAGLVILLDPRDSALHILDAATLAPVARHVDLGDRASPRLHADGSIYFHRQGGRELMRRPARGGADEAVHPFASPISIGGGEGDWDETWCCLPILRGDHVGILDMRPGAERYIEIEVGPGIDWAQVGYGGNSLAVGRAGVRSYLRDGTRLVPGPMLAPTLGHEDTASIGERPYLVTTTAAWPPGSPEPWGSIVGGGTRTWIVRIDMLTGEIVTLAETPWEALHVAGMGRRIIVSFSTGERPEVWLLDAAGGPPRVIATRERPATGYIDETHAALSDDGRRVYYWDGAATRRVKIR
jgi:hypothetical protein